MRTLSFFIFLATSIALHAGDEVIVLDQFSVSSGSSAREIPPITVRKPGDFLLLQIQLTNDTRDPDKRRAELYDTIKTILNASAAIEKMEISSVDMILNGQNYQINLQDAQSKSDTSTAELYLKLPLSSTDDVGALTGRLHKFAREIKVVGRTEIFPGEIGISVKNPEKFRTEVIAKVAEDVKKMRELFGDSFEIVVKGLDQRLRWQRVSVSELEFYIPYSYEVFPNRGSKMLINDK
ncbi:MAG TPA: hypothetical protein VFB27_12665 [Opitutaceae bacterium]|nr:hypothetical protein [Opitutaceae bacterium]